jgi:O-antigen ligase
MTLSVLEGRLPGRDALVLALLILLIFVLPIPGTIALRYLLLCGLLVALAWMVRRVPGVGAAVWRAGRAPLLLLVLFSVWLVAQAVAVSAEPGWALSEIRGQWVPAVLALLAGLGIGSGFVASRDRVRLAATVVVAALIAQTVFSLAFVFLYSLKVGYLAGHKTVLTAGKLEISYFNNLLLAFLAVEVIARWVYRQPFLRMPGWLIVVAILLAFYSNLAFAARNGIIGSVLLVFSLALIVAIREFRRIGALRAIAAGIACAVLVAGLAFASYRQDARWQGLSEKIGVAWDIDRHLAWRDTQRNPLPLTADGTAIDESTYTRIAWIHAGLRLWIEYPLGVGYGRNAFGHALRKSGDSTVGHAHSGWIDLGVGTGIPGLLLWGALMLALIIVGLRRYFGSGDSLGLVLAFVAGGFSGRMVLDSINRDHMLMLFLLLAGFLLVARDAPEKPINGTR